MLLEEIIMNVGGSSSPGTSIIPLDPGFNYMHNILESMEKPAEALNRKTGNHYWQPFNQARYLSIPGFKRDG